MGLRTWANRPPVTRRPAKCAGRTSWMTTIQTTTAAAMRIPARVASASGGRSPMRSAGKVAPRASSSLLLALGATFPALRIGERPPEALATLAGILMAAAVVVWIVVIHEVRPAHFAGRLVTGGLFAHVRNPIYSAFIFLECPGLALLAWSWPGLALPLVAYALYRRWIPLEEARLQ